jgi:hypothetical protein
MLNQPAEYLAWRFSLGGKVLNAYQTTSGDALLRGSLRPELWSTQYRLEVTPAG